MYIVQGFVQIPKLADNHVNQVAKFGEMSQHAMTFSKDIRNYSDTQAFPDIEIITMKAIDDKSTNIDIPPDLQVKMLTVADWIYKQYSKNQIPNKSAKATLQTSITSEYKWATGVKIGEIMDTGETGKRLIDYIQFDVIVNQKQWRFTLWFNDSRFRGQYRYYELIVIPPVDDINRLIGKTPDVALALQNVKIPAITNKINTYNKDHKFTQLHTEELAWHDISDKESILRTSWTIIIYGNQGSDSEVIKSAIRDYLQAHSEYTKWPEVFPDLYSSNEFVIIPVWDAIASPDTTYDDGLYRTMVTQGKVNQLISTYLPSNYKIGKDSDAFINEHVTMGSLFYRAMMFLSLGSPSNKGDKFSLPQLFPDYMAVDTKSPDFSRMSVKTQNFVLKLNECFNKARMYSPNDPRPEGYTVTIKGAREYIGFDFEGYKYFVMTHMGYLRDI